MREYPEQSSRLTSGAESSEAAFMPNSVVPLVIAATLALPLAPAQQPPVPSIDPPSGERLLLRLEAEGVQIYSCASDKGAPAWRFQGPEAKLTSAKGRPAGSHFAGPTWKLLDGSEVKGSPVASKPAPEPDAVPWLLLKVASETGDGKLRGTDYITRTNTKGGVAPPSGCDPSHQGAQARIPYSASYSFYGK